MIFLFNKAKICSYLVALSTVIALFLVATNIDKNNITIQTWAHNKSENNVINNLKSNENQ